MMKLLLCMLAVGVSAALPTKKQQGERSKHLYSKMFRNYSNLIVEFTHIFEYIKLYKVIKIHL